MKAATTTFTRAHRGAVLCALALVALPVAGCASGGDDARTDAVVDESADGPAVADPANAGAGEVVLPLDTYGYADDEARVIGTATQSLVEACVQSYGLPATAAHPLPAAATDTGTANRHDRRYAVADADVARQYGYHAPAGPDIKAEFYASHTPAELLVLGGADGHSGSEAATAGGKAVPTGGCLGAATGQLMPDPKARAAGNDLVASIQAEAWHAAQDDPRVVELFADWSACMADAGYQYAAPMQANDDPQWQRAAGTPAELATATADVACKDALDVVAIWSSVEAEYQQALIDQHAAALEAYRGVLDADVQRAEAAADAG